MRPETTKVIIEGSDEFDVTHLGKSRDPHDTRHSIHELKLPFEDRLTHTFTLGPTGSGKTQLAVHAALQDAYQGRGFAFINPKGDAIDQILAKMPEDRLDDVIYINPAQEQVTGVNVLEPHGTQYMADHQKEHHREIIVSDVLDLFRRQNDDDLGKRWGKLLEVLVRSLVEQNIQFNKNYTLIDVYDHLTDEQKLGKLIDRTQDKFLRDQLKIIKDNLSDHELMPLKHRLNDFNADTIRAVIDCPESGFDFREALNNQSIILIDLQEGDLGGKVSKIIGSIVLSKIWSAAQSRITMREEDREMFYVYIDEVQHFAGEGSSLMDILSKAREYKLGLWLASQFFRELPPRMGDAIRKNCRTRIVFDVTGEENPTDISRMLGGREVGRIPEFEAFIDYPSRGTKGATLFATYPPYPGDRSGIENVKLEATYPSEVYDRKGEIDTDPVSTEEHGQLLLAAEAYFEERGMALLPNEQDVGTEKPDAELITSDGVMHVEAEKSTVSKPFRVLANLRKAVAAGRGCVFVVPAGEGPTLQNILTDPVNRRGSDHEDDEGTFSYYRDGDEEFTDTELVEDAEYEVYEAVNGSLRKIDEDVAAECPELDTFEREDLEAWCPHRTEDNFCEALGQPCVFVE